MSSPRGNVRGIARPRGGATDTTMLIWKVIAANPGIDRAGIWERVEHGIPEGYALRRYAAHRASMGLTWQANDPACHVEDARKFVLNKALATMRYLGSLAIEHDGDDRRYTVARELNYKGDPTAIDETNTRAAEHMARADALRILKAARARANPRATRGPSLTIRRGRELQAFDLLLDALSNTPSAS